MSTKEILQEITENLPMGGVGPVHKIVWSATAASAIVCSMTTESLKGIVHSDPEIMGGTLVFVGTRVPFQNLIDYLSSGDTVDDFLEDFPTVTREQALAALDWVREALTSGAHPSR